MTRPIVQAGPEGYRSAPTDRYGCWEQEAPVSMVESRTTKMNEISERLERKQYEVDTQAVATALIERLLAGRVLAKAPRTA